MGKLFEYSHELNLNPNKETVEHICRLMYNEEFTKENRLFVFHQLKRFYLLHPEVERTELVEKLYFDVLHEWKNKLSDCLNKLSQQNRNKDTIAVLTLQFLGKSHAPTNSALERIYTLGALLNKQVIVLNTREQLTEKGILEYENYSAGTVIKQYDGVNITDHNGYQFALIQPEIDMPDEEMVRVLLEEIRNMAPWLVITIGSRCLFGDLCAEIIPTICFPMTFSTVPKCENEFIAVGRDISETEMKRLQLQGYNPDAIIPTTFTFELKPQTTVLAKDELNLPKDKFLIGVIGIRLDYEITEDFINTILSLSSEGIHIVFAGVFDHYEEMCERILGLKENSTFIGYQKDILAVWDLLDLYVNPYRVGGGFSVAEAFFKGKPGITVNYGDVYASAGNDFAVESIREYPELIRRYMNDSGFYEEMSRKAVERSKRLFDSKTEMEKILETVQSRNLWF